MAPGGSPSVCDGFEQTLHSANFLDFPRGRTLGEEGLVIYGKVVLGTQHWKPDVPAQAWNMHSVGKLGLAIQDHPQLQTEF